jgi:homoserine dehydrogenase
VAGLGTVGTGLLDLLAQHQESITRRAGIPVEVIGISARNKTKNRGRDVSQFKWFDDPVALAASPAVDVFVELMGGEGDPAKAAVETALKSSKHVVTANKALLAHGRHSDC